MEGKLSGGVDKVVENVLWGGRLVAVRRRRRERGMVVEVGGRDRGLI
jgi:hypothetical protein